MKTYKLKCQILSPLHIGAGEEINPLDYIIKDDRCYRVSFENFVAGMSEKERAIFESLIDKGDLVEMRKYITANIDAQKDSVYSTQVGGSVSGLYRSKMADIQNQLIISPFLRTERGARVLIPGSSIKGAIRTAVISEIAKGSRLPSPKEYREEDEFEAKVMGYKDGKDDPFRGIKIRDVGLDNDAVIVREVKNLSKKGNALQTNEMQMICEVLHSLVTGTPIEFETSISFDDYLFSLNFLSKKLTMEMIVRSCNAFYRDKVEKEHDKFYKGTSLEGWSSQLLSTMVDENSFLLRIGRYSGVESVTFDNYRKPKPPGKKGVWGTSRNLAEGKYPMGWVKVSINE